MGAPVQERRSEPGVTAARGGKTTTSEDEGLPMPASVYERLQLGVAILNALENRRARTSNDTLHRDLEQRIIQRELDELERESMAHKQERNQVDGK